MTNTEEIKRLAEIIWKTYANFAKDYKLFGFPDAIRTAIAKAILEAGYLPSAALVRPLVWEERKKGYWYAESPIWSYQVEDLQVANLSAPNQRVRVGFINHAGYRFLNWCDTVDEAKSIAQNHYNRIIGSCLQGGGWRNVDANTPSLTQLLVYYPDKMRVRIADMKDGKWCESGEPLDEPPTHWMPLPEAPLTALKQQ